MSQVALEVLLPSTDSLPKPPTPLIGRQHEISTVRTLLQRSQARLITFTGPPGVGKSRLCLQIAHDLATDFPDGLCFVPLAPIRDAEQVTAVIAQRLDLQVTSTEETVERLQSALSRRRMLLILDNFEQVLAAAPLLAALLAAAHDLTIFVTSRVALRLSGEHEYPVPPLTLPTLEQTPMALLLQSPAIALFVARAQAVMADFQLTEANAAVVAEICRRLAGLPLAIELAAARSKLLPPPALLARLSNRLATLTHGARDLPARQQTLRAAIEWSYDLLAPGEKALFRRLGIFRGDWTVEAVEAICSDLPQDANADSTPLDPFEGLATLLDHSLIYAVPTASGEARYAMLELLTEFAQEELARRGEEADLRFRHAQYYLGLAQQVPVGLEIPVQSWYDQLELEDNNLQSALQWALSSEHYSQAVLAINTLGRFWWERGHLNTSLLWTQRALDRELQAFGSSAAAYLRAPFPLPPTHVRAELLYHTAFSCWTIGNGTEALAVGEQSLNLYRQLNDQRGASWLTRLLGMVLADQGEWLQAQTMLVESLALCQTLGDRGASGFVLLTLGRVSFHLGDIPRSATLFAQSEKLFRQIGQIEGLFFYLREVGELTVKQGDAAKALPKLEESINLARQIDHKAGVVGGLLSLAMALLHLQEDLAALHKTQEALALLHQMSVHGGMGGCYTILTKLAQVHQLEREALTFWQMAATFRFHRGLAVMGDSLVTQLLTGLEQHFQQALEPLEQRGATTLSLKQALSRLEEVLQTQAALPPPALAQAPASPSVILGFAELTTREAEVLQLLADGLTYTEIAEKLVVSPRTVDAHLRAIYGKLGVNSRHEATRLFGESKRGKPQG